MDLPAFELEPAVAGAGHLAKVNPCNKGSMKATKAGIKGPISTSADDEIFQVIQEMQSRIESLEQEVQDLKDIIYSLQEQ